TYALAFTGDLIEEVYDERVTVPGMLEEGGYVDLLESGDWWVPSGRQGFDEEKFYLPIEAIDPFDKHTTIEYDDYALLVTEISDPLRKVAAVQNDDRTMSTVKVADPNGSRAAVLLDELGMVLFTAVMGKDGGSEGDSLEDPEETATTKFE